MSVSKFTLTVLFMTLVIGTGLSLHRISVAYGNGNMDGTDGGMDATGGTGGTGGGMDNNNGNNDGNNNPTDSNTGQLGPSGTEENPTDTTTEFQPDSLCDPAMSVTRDLVTTNCPEDNASSGGGETPPKEDCDPDTPATNDITCPEICDNGIDDNNDGLTDEEDSDCAANGAPTAEASGPATVNEGDSVTLSGAQSKDPDDDEITYSWTQTGGPSVSLDDPESSSPSFTAVASQGAPCVDGKPTSTLTFQLVVSDGQDDSSPASVTVKVIRNYDPLTATVSSSPQSIVRPGGTVSLSGSYKGGTGCGKIEYDWTQISGSATSLTAGASANPTFLVPYIKGPEVMAFSLKVKEPEAGIESQPVAVGMKVCPSLFSPSLGTGNEIPNIPQIVSGDCDYSKIDVRGGNAASGEALHLFIVYTDRDGTEYYIRGGPSTSPTPFKGGGPISIASGLYRDWTVDWQPNAAWLTIQKGGIDPNVWKCLQDVGAKITAAKITYYLTGPNSNSVVKTLLTNCNLPVLKPMGGTYPLGWIGPRLDYPGWELPPIVN
jgi:K319-like protein